MILFKQELITKIRTCICGYDVLQHHGEPIPELSCGGGFQAQKTQTRRWWKSARAKAGSVQRANTDYYTWTGLSLHIKDVRMESLEWWPHHISEEDARAEGFESVDAFVEYFNKVNSPRDLYMRRCYAVTFAIVRPA